MSLIVNLERGKKFKKITNRYVMSDLHHSRKYKAQSTELTVLNHYLVMMSGYSYTSWLRFWDKYISNSDELRLLALKNLFLSLQ